MGEQGVTETKIELNNLLEGEEYKFRIRSFQESTGRLSAPSNEVCRPAKWTEPIAEEIAEETTLEEVRNVVEEEYKETVIETDDSIQTVKEQTITETKEQITRLEVEQEQPAVTVPATPINVKVSYKPENVACLEWKSGEEDGTIPADITFVVETQVKEKWSTIVQNIKGK